MFERLGHLAYRRRRVVLVLAAAFVAFAATWGTGVFGSLTSGGFQDPNAESSRALTEMERTVGRSGADLIVLYHSPSGRTVDDPAYRSAVESALGRLPRAEVASVTTYWSTGGRAENLVSRDRTSTYAAVLLRAESDDDQMAAYHRIEPVLRDAPAGLTVRIGGAVALNSDITSQVREDIGKAEELSLPVVLVLLVVIFGGLAAASLPLAIGGLAILGAFTMLRLLTLVTDVSVFSINIVTMLGLGLAIDYGLFVVSRFREELRTGQPTETALARTMATAGRTVAFSGLTVAIALASLLLFPQVFLRSMGFGGMAVVLVDMLAALTVLPALLAVLGHRVNALRVPLPRALAALRRRSTAPSGAGGGWARLAHSVMRRPVVYVLVIVPLLVAIGLPFLRVQFGGVDQRALPRGAESRVVADTLLKEFGGGDGTSTIDAVVQYRTGTVDQSSLAGYVARLRALPGVQSAQVVGARAGTAHVSVGYAYEGISAPARELVGEVRALEPPQGATVLVGGRAAELRDLLHSLGQTLPWMGLFVVGVTFVLLFLAFGSLVLPAKALVMNVLSISASFGALVWIFQDGHLSGLLHFDSSGTIEATQPILMLALAFGLSMDYELFLLSRVREEWDRTRDNAAAVAAGLQRSGGIITSAALLLIVVIGAFSTSGIVFIKMIGVGMILAILVDATVVRALLVPATMRLLGRANWWAPRPLARWWERHGWRESADGHPVPVARPEEERVPVG